MKKYELIVLPENWVQFLLKYPADRGGYQTGIVVTQSGNRFKASFANSTYIYYVENYDYVPFSEDDIVEIVVTNEQLDNKKRMQRGHYVCEKGYLKVPLPIKSIQKE